MFGTDYHRASHSIRTDFAERSNLPHRRIRKATVVMVSTRNVSENFRRVLSLHKGRDEAGCHCRGEDAGVKKEDRISGRHRKMKREEKQS